MSRYKAVYLALALTLSCPAMAEVPDLAPLNYTVRYDIYWNKIPLGRMRVTATEDQFSYKLVVDTKTGGMGGLFEKDQTIAQVRGRVHDGQYIPTEYRSDGQKEDGKPKHTVLRYDADGKLISRERKPVDDPAWRPLVPTAEASTATDPITAFVRLRKKIHDNMARNARDSTERTYEGARLAEFTVKVISRARIEAMKDHFDAVNTVVKRTLINGYTPKEKKKYAEKGDPTVHLYFSADERFIPLRAEANLPFGSLSAVLTEFK